MAIHIRYMGSKHLLAPHVARIIATLPDGPCLDLFSGMCSIAGAIAPSMRAVWCNDIQKYSSIVANALLTSSDVPPSPSKSARSLFRFFATNLGALKSRFEREVAQEALALSNENWIEYARLSNSWRHAGNDEGFAHEVQSLRRGQDFPYRLATLNFAHGYFGLRQAMELDSLRFAIERGASKGVLSPDEANWCLVALLQTASHLSSTPGHFAEYLHVKNRSTYMRVRALRRRSAWSQFLVELETMSPYGSRTWRRRNRVFSEEASLLCKRLLAKRSRPSVVYADPPYSKAQYSRYYHVLETLVLYDYPPANGMGRYRENRFRTPFSNVSTIATAFSNLAAGVAELGAVLVLSYPSNGLLLQMSESPESYLYRHYRSVKKVFIGRTRHSTLGASNGIADTEVDEMIFVSRRPRN